MTCIWRSKENDFKRKKTREKAKPKTTTTITQFNQKKKITIKKI
jgi:hypothetical protein